MEGPLRRRRGALHFGRYGEILSVFVKYGFGDIIASLNIEKYAALTSRLIRKGRPPVEVRKVSRWERVRLAVEELGPTFVKLGQFMSNRPDLLPAGLIAELERLQDATAPFPTGEARRIVEAEIHRPLEGVLDDFGEAPVAAASIAQVHTARLADGTRVAVKIQRPNIRQTIHTDIDILYHLAALIESRFDRFRALQLGQLVEEFERVIGKELDFTTEAAHLERFRAAFGSDGTAVVPGVHGDFTTRKVLVTDFIDGIKVSDVEALDRAGLDRKEVARKGAAIVLRQVFEHGFFHADPHPGNILVQTDGRICLLDFGAVGIIPPSLRQHLSIILYGVVNRDSQKIVRTLSMLSHGRIRDMERLEYDVTEFIEEYSLSMLGEINVGDALRRFADIIVDHGLRIVPGFYLLLKTLITIEGVGARLDPDFRLSDHLQPYVKSLIRENLRWRHLPYDLYFTIMDLAALARDLPFDLKDIARMVRAGDLRIQFEHKGLEPMLSRHETLVNRLAFAIVLAALIVGSSVVIHSGMPPQVYGIPLVGILGFVAAAAIGFGILISMLRHRRM